MVVGWVLKKKKCNKVGKRNRDKLGIYWIILVKNLLKWKFFIWKLGVFRDVLKFFISYLGILYFGINFG